MSPLFLCLYYKILTPASEFRSRMITKAQGQPRLYRPCHNNRRPEELLQVSYSRACHYTAKNWISLRHFILKISHCILTVIVESVHELGDGNHCSYLKTIYIYILSIQLSFRKSLDGKKDAVSTFSGFFIFKCMGFAHNVCTCTTYMQCPTRPEEGVGAPGTVDRDGYELIDDHGCVGNQT